MKLFRCQRCRPMVPNCEVFNIKLKKRLFNIPKKFFVNNVHFSAIIQASRSLGTVLFHDTQSRSRQLRCSLKKTALKSFAIFTGKHLRWSLFLIKLQGEERSAILLKRDSNICDFL